MLEEPWTNGGESYVSMSALSGYDDNVLNILCHGLFCLLAISD